MLSAFSRCRFCCFRHPSRFFFFTSCYSDKVAMPPINDGEEDALKMATQLKVVVVTTKGTSVDEIVRTFADLNEPSRVISVNDVDRGRVLRSTGRDRLPVVFVKGDCLGGTDDLRELKQSGVLEQWLQSHKYDLVVVGGGSGGLAAAKEAAQMGRKVACLDYVAPSPQGTSWGLGGTCLNVGCIPKKLMHQAALLGRAVNDAGQFGWTVNGDVPTLEWTRLKDAIQAHIASVNWNHRVLLREKKVTYLNSVGRFVGPFELMATNKRGKEEILTADRFLIATGLRPRYPGVPGAKECCITSDDLFSLPYNPGKTLCVGASYVSLECAGFLRGFDLDVTVMVRSILLRGFDQDMAERIGRHMESEQIRFMRSTVPVRFELLKRPTDDQPGSVSVTAETTNADGQKRTTVDVYNTVLLAIGRDALTDQLALDRLAVQTANDGKVVGRHEQSVSAPYVYAIGDVLHDKPELTPVAIHAGRALARRLYTGNGELVPTEYDHVPTTVFTPLEYACCGLSEEVAVNKFGLENINVFHNAITPLEYTLPHRSDSDHCYCKLICVKNDQNRMIGMHVLSPNAGEIMQGFGLAFKMGAKKSDLDRLIGIHPTIAETLTKLTILKSEQAEVKQTGC